MSIVDILIWQYQPLSLLSSVFSRLFLRIYTLYIIKRIVLLLNYYIVSIFNLINMQNRDRRNIRVPSDRLRSLSISMTSLLHPYRSPAASCASHIFIPVDSVTSSIHRLLGLPRPRPPSPIPSMIDFSKPFPFTTCPK